MKGIHGFQRSEQIEIGTFKQNTVELVFPIVASFEIDAHCVRNAMNRHNVNCHSIKATRFHQAAIVEPERFLCKQYHVTY